MIPVPPGVRVLLATRPVDFRKGAHGLAALAAVEFAALFDGLDWTHVQPLRRIPQPTAAA
ncbi:MAG: hypothetical protein M0002_18355 [Rhodospirillales bacterium]|uniref:hypothetical protein n=1 Tax=Acidiphilium sp. TaxID=527 RepID=UPI0023105BF4|nr:hypothetical protein [Acidiphilium sp.]MDA8051936.1 hypothetical protein [Rhodospirillales bacterium]